MHYKTDYLAAPQCNWHNLIQTCQNLDIESPTRGLDQIGWKVEDMAALPACINLENKPKTFRDNLNTKLFEHLVYSFVHVMSTSEVFQCSLIPLTISWIKVDETYIVYTSGSLNDIHLFIMSACTREEKKARRALANDIFDLLSESKLGELFNVRQRVYLSDGTFIL